MSSRPSYSKAAAAAAMKEIRGRRWGAQPPGERWQWSLQRAGSGQVRGTQGETAGWEWERAICFWRCRVHVTG
jgi:hypothetical protein